MRGTNLPNILKDMVASRRIFEAFQQFLLKSYGGQLKEGLVTGRCPTCMDAGNTVNSFKTLSGEEQDLWAVGVFRHQEVVNNVGSGSLRVSLANYKRYQVRIHWCSDRCKANVTGRRGESSFLA